MPLSSLLFRGKAEAASNNKAPHHPMRHHPPAPPPSPPLLAVAAAITRKPLLGLKTIADAHVPGEQEHRCVNRSSVLSSSASGCSSFSASSSPSASSTVGSDHREDGEDVGDNARQEEEEEEEEEDDDDDEDDDDEDDDDDERCCWASYGRRSGVRRLPPPITVLAKADGENRCLMPWVLRRSYEDGGRLVMREVKVENQEFLKPCRAGGRLTIKVVQLHEPDTPATSPLSAPTQARAPTAPVPVPAPTPQNQNHRREAPKPAMQPPSTLLPSSPEKERDTETWRPVWSGEEGAAAARRRGGAPRFASSSLVMLSSSLPEPTTKGCYVNARPDSLLGLMVAARMPPVHS